MATRRGRAAALLVAGLGLSATTLTCLAPPAGASMEGGCTAVATFLLGVGAGSVTIDVGVASSSEPVEIAATDTVEWRVTVPGSSTPEPMRGRLEIDLPWPLGTQTLESWSGTATQGEATGLYTYELTKAFPRGTAFTVTGNHSEPGVTCIGEVALQVDGGPFDTWLIWVALGGLLVSAILLLAAGRSRWVQVG
jgi:hypothetical protein